MRDRRRLQHRRKGNVAGEEGEVNTIEEARSLPRD